MNDKSNVNRLLNSLDELLDWLNDESIEHDAETAQETARLLECYVKLYRDNEGKP